MSKRHTTTVETKISVQRALELAPAGTLTAEQERVLRMRSGSPVDPKAPLELVGQKNPELRAKLAMIEALAMEAMAAPAPRRTRASTTDNATKAMIIAKLRQQ